MAETSPPEQQPAAARRKRLVRWTSALAAAAVAGIFVWGLLASRAGSTGAAALPDFYGLAGQTAQNFSLRDLTNAPVSLSNFLGQRVVLNFWYVACAGCQTEMPDLEQFSEQTRGQHIVILGVNILDDANSASQFLQRLGITYPVVLDQHQRVFDGYHLTSTPSSILIDARGIIRGSVSGPLTLSQLQRYAALLR